MTSRNFGLSVALSTPFLADGGVAHPACVEHARQCLRDGAQSVTLFGTTGEGFSISTAERTGLLRAFKTAGFDMRREVGIGIMASAPAEAAAQIAEGLALDCRHFLLTPPFFFKGAMDDGIFGWYCSVIDALGERAHDLILYNLPSQTAVPLSLDLIGRLKARYPGAVSGVKDSSSNLAYSRALVATHGDLAILIGDERHLADIIRRGGQGSICGLGNFEAARVRRLIETGHDDSAITDIVDAVCSYPVLAAVKAVIASDRRDPDWARTRPPVMPLAPADAKVLIDRVAAVRSSASSA